MEEMFFSREASNMGLLNYISTQHHRWVQVSTLTTQEYRTISGGIKASPTTDNAPTHRGVPNVSLPIVRSFNDLVI